MCVAKVIEIIREREREKCFKLEGTKNFICFTYQQENRDVFHGEHMNVRRGICFLLKSRGKLWCESWSQTGSNYERSLQQYGQLIMILKLLRKKDGFSACCWSWKENISWPNESYWAQTYIKNLTTLKPRICSGKKIFRKDCWNRNEDLCSQYSDP